MLIGTGRMMNVHIVRVVFKIDMRTTGAMNNTFSLHSQPFQPICHTTKGLIMRDNRRGQIVLTISYKIIEMSDYNYLIINIRFLL